MFLIAAIAYFSVQRCVDCQVSRLQGMYTCNQLNQSNFLYENTFTDEINNRNSETTEVRKRLTVSYLIWSAVAMKRERAQTIQRRSGTHLSDEFASSVSKLLQREKNTHSRTLAGMLRTIYIQLFFR